LDRTGAWRSVGDLPPLAIAPKLRVHDVGRFETSFVPHLVDFDRLDERFRLPPDVWDRLSVYKDYGFAVFKLKGSGSGELRGLLDKLLRAEVSSVKPRGVHPMALECPRRNPELLYFPTVHVHDRTIYDHATFDHMLYCQPDPKVDAFLQGWEPSHGPARKFIDVARTESIVNPNGYCWRRPLSGRLENRDTLVGKGGVIPESAVV
jgi:hypothetical protein